jgi:phage shock protein PspC (stress-responsive transcriptional regulator)
MRPVIRVSLNGRALQLEDDAHALLAQYLESAARTLEGNPDRAEILADLEVAIADKSARFTGPARDVLNREQIATVLDEIGPVEPVPNGVGGGTAREDVLGAASGSAGADARSTAGASAASGSAGASPRRLHQITDGAMISGVCNGLAAWSSLDVTIVRIVAVILAFVTGGAAVLVYVLLMFILPFSPDSGTTRGLPRASRSAVERLRGETAAFTSSEDWQRFGADARHAWERAQARARREWEALRSSRAAATASTPGAPNDGGHVPTRIATVAERARDTSAPSPAIVLALIVLLIAVVALA